VQSNLKKWTD